MEIYLQEYWVKVVCYPQCCILHHFCGILGNTTSIEKKLVTQIQWPFYSILEYHIYICCKKNKDINNRPTLTPLGSFPSTVSFLLWQSAHRKGPCHGFDQVKKIESAWTEMPSLDARQTWYIAHTKMPDVDWTWVVIVA